MDRAGVTGWGTYGVALLSPRYGHWERGAQRIINLMGPAASDISQLVDVAMSEDKPKQAARFISRNTPLMNIHKPLREEYKQSLEALMGGSKSTAGSRGR